MFLKQKEQVGIYPSALKYDENPSTENVDKLIIVSFASYSKNCLVVMGGNGGEQGGDLVCLPLTKS